MESSNQAYNLPKDAVWLITGCSSGIGRTLASQIASDETSQQRVVATARNPKTLDGLTAEDDKNPRLLKVALDVTSPTSINAAFDAALARFGRVDVVVNNAGYGLMGDAEVVPDADARALMDTNFWGVVDVTRRALAVFRDVNGVVVDEDGKEKARGGVVLNVTSMGGYMTSPGSAFYHASKFAVEGFTEAVAKEVLPEWNIHLCNIEPGGVRTNYATTSMKLAARHPSYDVPHGPTNGLLAYVTDPANHGGFASPESIASAMRSLVGGRRRRGNSNNGAENALPSLPVRCPLGPDSWTYVMLETKKCEAELSALREFSCAAGNQAQLETMKGLSMGL